jgi:pimeloyl-ACP methyl ester carboxylesterase
MSQATPIVASRRRFLRDGTAALSGAAVALFAGSRSPRRISDHATSQSAWLAQPNFERSAMPVSPTVNSERSVRRHRSAFSTSQHAAQLAALKAWGQLHSERYGSLRNIPHRTLVVNGHDDIMVPTVNSFILQQKLPDARLILFPDSGHGSHFQFPEEFAEAAARFLAAA